MLVRALIQVHPEVIPSTDARMCKMRLVKAFYALARRPASKFQVPQTLREALLFAAVQQETISVLEPQAAGLKRLAVTTEGALPRGQRTISPASSSWFARISPTCRSSAWCDLKSNLDTTTAPLSSPS